MRKRKSSSIELILHHSKRSICKMRMIKILYWNLHWKVHLLEEASVSPGIPTCMGFMEWWYDVKRSEACQGIKVPSMKEVVEGSLDYQKKEMRYVCLYLIKKSHVIWLQISWMSALPQEHNWKKGSPSVKECMKAQFTHWLDEISIICPHMKYEVVDKIGGTMTGSS